MSLLILPETIPLHCETATTFRAHAGQVSPTVALTYPEFFIKGEDVRAGVPQLSSCYSIYGDKWPAIVEGDCLVFDPAWRVFEALCPMPLRMPSGIIEQLQAGALDWALSCPALKGYKTLVARILGLQGDIAARGTEAVAAENPLCKVLAAVPVEQLQAFADRGSLLDLATRYQQWGLAELLWDKGVRWSQETLQQGLPITWVANASTTLRGSLVGGFLNDFRIPHAAEKRVAWVERWLARLEECGCACPSEPALRWRSDAATRNGYAQAASLRDTPASLWIAFMFKPSPRPGNIPGLSETRTLAPHAVAITAAWARFWARIGVDLRQVAVARLTGEVFQGLSYHAQQKNAPEWIALVESEQQAQWLHAKTPRATATGVPIRL